MEERDEITIQTEYMKGIVSKAITKALKKKLERDINVQLNELAVTDIDEKLRVHLSVDAEIGRSELESLLKDLDVI